jgi:7-carboxy-7-deazaguanine synthase (Cx14CxxC type)
MDGPNGGNFASADSLGHAVDACWPATVAEPASVGPKAEAGCAVPWNGRAVRSTARRFVVCTGGEPLLQMDHALVDALHRRSFEVAVETNGTLPVPEGIDWVCVSPKAGSNCVVSTGDELKLVYPQEGGEPAKYERLSFGRFFLQPMDGPHLERHRQMAIEYCLAHPQWELSLQTHKLLGIR